MFEKFRKPGRAKSIFVTVIFGIICLVFVFLGMTPGNRLGGPMGGAAARVNDVAITFADFQQAYGRIEQQYRGNLDGLPEAQRAYYEKTMKARALDQLISMELISLAAEREGFRIADGEIRDQILSIPAFQDNGKFMRERYDQVLEANHMNMAGFEQKIRKDLLLRRLQQDFLGAFKSLPIEDEQNKVAQEYKMNLAFVAFDRESLTKKIPVDSKEIRNFVSNADDQQKVQKYYDDNKQKYAQVEEVAASHILIKATTGDKKSEDNALKKIEDIAKQATLKNFGELAKKYSEDAGSKNKGGDLGRFSKGRMVKEFEQAVFSLDKNKISAPVKTPYGYHLILIKDHTAATQKTLDQVRDDIAKQLIAETQVDSVIKKFEEALKNGKKDEVTAEVSRLNLKFEDTGENSISQEFWPKLQDSGAILDVVTQKGILSGLVPQLIQSRGSYYIVDVKSAKLHSDDKQKPAMDGELAAMRRSNQIFDLWYRDEAKNAKISRSPQVMGEVAETTED